MYPLHRCQSMSDLNIVKCNIGIFTTQINNSIHSFIHSFSSLLFFRNTDQKLQTWLIRLTWMNQLGCSQIHHHLIRLPPPLPPPHLQVNHQSLSPLTVMEATAKRRNTALGMATDREEKGESTGTCN